MTTIRLALDWTPNTIHTGILIAKAKGFYADKKIDIKLINPLDDNYSTTPAKKLINGDVDLAICPSESVIAYAGGLSKDGSKPNDSLVAIFALLDSDASSILCSSVITRPQDLDGKRYGSYNAKYEDDIIRTMIRNDGGRGDIVITIPDKLSLYDCVLSEQVDATWIFSPVEGVRARQAGFSGREFKVTDYGVPYGYSPLLVKAKSSSLPDSILRGFNEATLQGYQYAHENHDECVDILTSLCSEDKTFMDESLRDVKQYWGDGKMSLDKWTAFVDFLKVYVEVGTLFTNAYS